MTTTGSLTRRDAALALVGAVAATAGVATAAVATSTTDPIFAAIDHHRAACAQSSVACRAVADLESEDQSPASLAAHDSATAAYEASESAALALVHVRPATLAGVAALLAYVGNADHRLWPDELEDETIRTDVGRALTMPFAFWVIRNAHDALLRLGYARTF